MTGLEKLSLEADPHQLKGGLPPDFINQNGGSTSRIHQQKGGLPLDFINQKGVLCPNI